MGCSGGNFNESLSVNLTQEDIDYCVFVKSLKLKLKLPLPHFVLCYANGGNVLPAGCMFH